MLSSLELQRLTNEVIVEDKAIRSSLIVDTKDVLDSFDLWQISDSLPEFKAALAATGNAHAEAMQSLYGDLYSTIRGASGVKGRYRLVRPSKDVRGVVQWGISDLFGSLSQSNVDTAGRKIVNSLEAEVARVGRNVIPDTVLDEAKDEKKSGRIAYKRVAVGETCDFCLMVASRGAVYKNSVKAGEAKKWHHSCDCIILPEFI